MIWSEIRAQGWKWLSVALAVLAVAAVVACVFLWAGRVGADARADAAETRKEELASDLKAARETLAHERASAKAMTAIAEQAERDRKDAQAAYDRTVADLRSGAVRLQDRWAGCISEAGRSAAELDAAARDREESAARIIQAAREADAQIRGLQSVVEADRKGLVK